MKKLSLDKIKDFSFIKQALQHPKVEKIIVYGSRARGEENEFSDLDLCVVGAQISSKDWNEISEKIENNKDSLIPIDLVHYNKIDNLELLEAIDREGVSLGG